MKVGTSLEVPSNSSMTSSTASSPCRRRVGGGGGAPMNRFSGAVGARHGFWLGLCAGLLSVMALLAASESHQVGNDGGAAKKDREGINRRGGNPAGASKRSPPPSQQQGIAAQQALRATLRLESFQDAPSCVHTFGQLELMNSHPTDPIVIHSIRTVKERTVPVATTIRTDPQDETGASAASAPPTVSYECWEDGGAGGGTLRQPPGSSDEQESDDDELDKVEGGWVRAPEYERRGGLFSSSPHHHDEQATTDSGTPSSKPRTASPSGNASVTSSDNACNATNPSEAQRACTTTSSSDPWRLPRQIQANSFPSSSFVLGPNQVAIVPISFLPRFPPVERPLYPKAATTSSASAASGNNHPANATYPIYVASLAQRRDLERWLGPKRRSNRFLVGGEGGGAAAGRGPPRKAAEASADALFRVFFSQRSLYKVSATLLIETSVGVLELPVEATSRRGNDYGLPDRITFRSPPDGPSPAQSATGAAGAPPRATRYSSSRSSALHDEQQLLPPTDAGGETWQEAGSDESRPAVVVAVHSAVRRTDPPPEGLELRTAGGDGAESTASRPSPPSGTSSADGDEVPISQLEPTADGCYDLHIRNPASPSSNLSPLSHHQDPGLADGGSFAVLAVTVSMPDRVAIRFSASSSHTSSSSPPSKESGKISNDRRADDGSASANRGDWPAARDQYGGLLAGSEGIAIPADGRSHYVATLCPRYGGSGGKTAPPSSFSSSTLPLRAGTRGTNDEDDEESEGAALLVTPTQEETWLGFAHVLTSHDSLFVSLERQLERYIEPLSPGAEPAGVLSTDPNATLTNTSQAAGAPSGSFGSGVDQESHLQALPASIDTQLVSSAGPSVRVPVHLTYRSSSSPPDGAANAAPPVAIMRASAIYEVPKELSGIDFTVRVAGRGLNASSWIEVNETMKDSLIVECTVDWDKFAFVFPHHQPVLIEGAVVVRGSSLMWSYEEWEEAMKIDPSLDAHLVAEIPLRLKLVKGEVGMIIQSTSHPDGIFWSYRPWGDALAVSAAFFPACQDGVRASLSVHESSDFYQLPAMTHQLRVFSNVEVATRVRKAQIVAAKELSPSSSLMPSNSLCHSFHVSVQKDRDDRYDGIVNSTDLGLIELTYRFQEANMSITENQSSSFPVTCYLKLTTEPDTGSHFMPLVIYTGHVDLSVSQLGRDVSAQTENEGVPFDEDESTMWHRTVIGFDRVLTWLLSTKAGTAFRAVLGVTSKKADSDRAMLERFISGISRPLVNSKVKPFYRPVLVQAGALAHGEIEKLPLYVTNTNPVPIEVWIDVGEVEGMSLALGRDQSSGRGDGNSILDYLPEPPQVHFADGSTARPQPRVASGAFSGHPINGLRQFLLNDDFATSFFSQFPYRAAISLSAAAAARLPMLQDLFMTFSLGEFYRHQLPFRFFPGSWSRCNNSVHPPHYRSFDQKPIGGKSIGPLIVSNDGRFVRELPVCWDRDGEPDIKRRSEDISIHLPPGATARFDVRLRAPSQNVLEKDITQFLTTGLVLSTNHGEVMPVFVSFEALQGRFDVSHVPSSHIADSTSRDGVIPVPMKLFGPRFHGGASSCLTIPPKPSRHSSTFTSGEIVRRNVTSDRNGVTLYMRSTFTREVRLRKVLSCNPWFQFEPNRASEPKIDPIRGIEIGVVTSAVPCDAPSELARNSTWNPSFFRCLLNWLENRTNLQPSSCGMVPTKESSPRGKDSTRMSETAGIERAIRGLKRALVVSHYTYGPFNALRLASDSFGAYKSRDRTSDGVVSQLLIDVMAEAWDSWRAISAHGLNSMSTSMRAVIDYNSTDGDALPIITQVLSVALRNLTIESVFQTPRILDAAKARQQRLNAVSGTDASPAFIEFPATSVAGVSYISIPLRNPTSVPVKVRLSVFPTRENSQGSFTSVLKVEKSVKNRFLHNIAPPYVQNAVSGASQDQGDLRNDWWGDGAGYFMPDLDGDIMRSRHNVTIVAGPHAVVSLYNPSLLASTLFLLGCGSRCSVKDEITPAEQIQTTTIGAGAAIGSSIMGQIRWAKPNERRHTLMPAGSSPLSNAAGPSAFALPYSALDEVVIPPQGEAEIGPVVFRPPGRSSTIGCRAFSNSGMSTDCASEAFQGLLFLENSLTGLERVVLKGQGQIQRIDFIDPLPTEGYDPFGDIELRHGFPTLVFSGSGVGKESIVKEVVMVNTGDVSVHIVAAYLSGTSSSKAACTGRYEEASPCNYGGFFLRDCIELNEGFALGPGQNRSIVLELYQHCRFRKAVVSLGFEIGQANSQRDDSRPQLSNSALSSYAGAHAIPGNSVAHDSVELKLLYEMSEVEFASCLPMNTPPSVKLGFKEHKSSNATSWTFTAATKFARQSGSPIALGAVLFAILVGAVALLRWLLLRQHLSLRFHSSLAATKSGRLAAPGSSWLTAFRILARVDPSPQDLKNLGREQARHILLPRYRSYGGHMPHCISATGAFQREKLRLGFPNNGGKVGAAERTKTLSEALFQHFVPPEEGLGRLPCELGWRTAYMRGLINDGSLSASPVESRTAMLLIRRDQEPTVEEVQGNGESSDEAFATTDDESVDSEASTDFSEIDVPDLSSFAKPQRRGGGAKGMDPVGAHTNGNGSGQNAQSSIRTPVSFEDDSIVKRSPTPQESNSPTEAVATESEQRYCELPVPPVRVGRSEPPFSKARPSSEPRRKKRIGDASGPGQSRSKPKAADASAAVGGPSSKVDSAGKAARERKPKQKALLKAGQPNADTAALALSRPSKSSSTVVLTKAPSSAPRKNAWRSKSSDDPADGVAASGSPFRPPPGLPPPPGFSAPVAVLYPQPAASSALAAPEAGGDPPANQSTSSKKGSHSPVIERPRYTVVRKTSNDSIDAMSSGHSPLLAPPILNLSASLSGLNHPPPIPESFSLYDDAASGAAAAPPPPPSRSSRLYAESRSPPPPPSQITPLSATQGFDIMDFLDGVLNEAGGSSGPETIPAGAASASWDDDLLNDDGVPPASAMTIESLLLGLEGGGGVGANSTAIILDEDDSSNNHNTSFSGQLPLVSANPWASDPPTSAAATTRLSTLYGISIEDVSERDPAGGGGNENGDDGDLLVDLFPTGARVGGGMTTLAEGEATGRDDDDGPFVSPMDG